MTATLITMVLLGFYTIYQPASAIINLADVECGYPKAPFVRIKNGEDALFGEFPWNVALYKVDFNKKRTHYTCVGAIIHRRFIMTAAHCVQSMNPNNIIAILGEHTRSKRSKFERRMFIRKINIHPTFTISGAQVFNDIALLELTEDIIWNNLILPVCLPDVEYYDDSFESVGYEFDPLVGQTVTVAGWGLTDEIKKGGKVSDTLQKVQILVFPLLKCREMIEKFIGSYHPLSNRQLCAGVPEGNRDACTGDSGSPLIIRNSRNQRVAIGIVSTGFGCGRPQQPGIYTRVSTFMEWIMLTIELSGYFEFIPDYEESYD